MAAGVLSFAIGMFLSFTAAVVGGWVDQVLSRINDLMLAIPTLIFALVVLAALPHARPKWELQEARLALGGAR